ncbi:hypothetical protein [Alteromonas halophila]|uniref:Uncharacterized protein n=1 Tax=Alteromonas halophila TaxID=516698 RepID=A0A918MW86_9ALTE|nr:hypothetical protein [Alteromonas halophila]GGW78076.1 hypothetical protein GCM10007391_08290 [Alteromonas halophila]
MLYRIIAIMFCLVASVACYAMGQHAGIVIFVLLGVMFEMIFWIALTRRSQPVVKTPKTY